MAQQTLTTNPVTFLDYTDSRKLDVYITSNLPQTQIYNPNSGAYSPDWKATPLILSSDIFLDYEEITGATITWYEQIGSDAEAQIGTGESITISGNRMYGATASVTYTCKVAYQNTSAFSKITFVRSDTGLNGSDGTSVTIKDTAYYKGTLTDVNVGEVVVIYSDVDCKDALTTDELIDGDAYIVQGYLCVYNGTKNGFICAGEIRGPEGKSAQSIILNSTSQVFRISKNNVMSPSSIVITAQAINTTVTSWTYSTNGGVTFVSAAPAGVVQSGDQVTITGAELEHNVLVVKASDGTYSDIYTVYKISDGTDGRPGDAGQSASMAFLTNENITFSADEQGQVPLTSVSTNVVAYSGTTKVTPTLGTINTDLLPSGMTIESITEVSNELMITIKVGSLATLGSSLSNSGTINIPVVSPVSTVLTLGWSKINTGATGADGTDAVTFQVYSANGYVLSKDTPSVLLQTFAYNGDALIEAGATYQWYVQPKTTQYNLAKATEYDSVEVYYILDTDGTYKQIYIADEDTYNTHFGSGANAGVPLYVEIEWIELTETKIEEVVDENTGAVTLVTSTVLATSPYTTIRHTDVSFSTSYMCKMKFGNAEYVDVVTIDDKNDANIVFTSKPTSYAAGDIWIVGTDYAPRGVEIGTVLKAQHANSSYADADWVVGTKYDDKLIDLETDVGTYKQFISLDTKYGITMNAIDESGRASEFSTTLSNTQLSFNQAGEAVAYINNHKMHITEAEIESPLTVTGKYSGNAMLQAPTINLGNFSLVVEGNGSFSIVSNL